MNKYYRAVAAAHFLLAGVNAQAGMGTVANTFGLLPGDVGSSQASSLFSEEASAAYYNPAALAQTELTQFTPGYLYVSPELRLHSRGGSNPPTRTGSVLSDEKNNQVVIGLKLYLNNISPQDHNISWGLVMAVEDDGKTMLNIEDETSQEGQFMQYGEKPIFVSSSVGAEIRDGWFIGAGSRMNVHGTAPAYVESTLDGQTSHEIVNVQGSTTFSALVGTLLDFGKLFCEDKNRALCKPGLKLAAAYRQESFYSLELNAVAVIPGTINPPGVPLNVFALDVYMPSIIALGARYPINDKWFMDFTYELQRWSDLTDKLKSKPGLNSIKDQANAQFQDISVPRFALNYKGLKEYFNLNDRDDLTLIFGFALEESALKDGLTPDVNWLDNDRTVLSIGTTYTLGHSTFLNNPLSFTAAYQYHMLDDREFQLSNSDAPTEPFETVNADGEVSIMSFGLNLRF